MNRLIRLFLTGTLLFTLPVTAFAAAETPAAGETSTEKEQGTIHPPTSRQDSGNSSENTDISDSASDESSSAGVNWSDANTASSPAAGDGDYTVCIDPGHQGSWVDMSAQEPMAPGSSQTKNKATTGTSGNFSGVPEYEVNLQVSLVLKKELVSRGYKVVMTREDNDKAISNKERADFAAEQGADITVRIHANSDNSSSASGALTMSPTTSNQYLDQDIIQKSQTLSSCIIEHYCAATGLGNKGVISSDNMTGTNWSTIPVTILEMGFMSNYTEDQNMSSPQYQEKMMTCVADGLDNYFKNKNLDDICVVSPDHGGATRARKMAVALDCPVAIIDKRRPKPNVAEIMGVLGDVEGKNCVMIDDMIDTGGTIVAGIDMLLEKGAKNVFVACTHPVFSGPAVERLKNCSAKEVVVTDTIILPKEKHFDKLKVVSVASLLAKTIESIENNLPVSDVFQEFDFEK